VSWEVGPESRRVVVLEVDDLFELETAVAREADGWFCLLLALDAGSVSQVALARAAKAALASGLVYLCAWGPGCELVHDCFDWAIVDFEMIGAREMSEDDTVVTTWHVDESLEDAAEYFRDVAVPTDGYASCDLWLAAAVGRPDWAVRLRASLT
jgi:hypothetical protein